MFVNDAFSTFYIRLYGIIHMVKDHSDDPERKPATTSSWHTLSDCQQGDILDSRSHRQDSISQYVTPDGDWLIEI